MRRSKFNLSHTHLLSCDMGELIPLQCLETLPGDSFQVQTSLLVRCAPMLAPPMHPVRVRVHHWFVPFRLIWDEWEQFITGGPDGNNASAFPSRNTANISAGGLLNYLGLPVNAASPGFSMLPPRAYNLIWNEYYRDQDLQTAALMVTTSGTDNTTQLSVRNVCWEKDYFTSARPWEQKGPAVTIPLVGNAPISGMAVSNAANYTAGPSAGYIQPTGATATGTNWSSGPNPNTLIRGNDTTKVPDIYADLSAVSGVTVNNLRQSLAIQRFEEARAMYGSRYPEYLAALGVRSSDARLDRPEYLGGGTQTIQFSEVIQTAADGANPVSTLRGHGITAMKSNRFRRFFEEHGFVMTLMSVIPKTIYTTGMPRMWNRRTKFDFWQRELETIGQQPILNKEVRSSHANPDGVFGYIDRYDEYRRQWSKVSGEFATSTLNYWHFARDFTTDPALNSTFVSAVPAERPFASPSTDVLYVQAYNSVQARRLVTANATPRTF